VDRRIFAFVSTMSISFRRVGSSGSRGRKAPPALRIPRMAKDLRDTTFETDSDNTVGTDTLLAQHTSKTVGLGVELSVGEVLSSYSTATAVGVFAA
jgi:hypothetical protein